MKGAKVKFSDKIHMINEVNRLHNYIMRDLPEQLKPFIGKKIATNTGLTKKFQDAVKLPDFEPIPLKGGHVSQGQYISADNYSLTVTFKLCFWGGSYEDKTYYCEYKNGVAYIGSMEEKDLKEIDRYNFEPLAKIDAEQEFKRIQELREAEAKADKIRKTIKVSSEIYKYL